MGLGLPEIKALIQKFQKYFPIEIEVIEMSSPKAYYNCGSITITSGLISLLDNNHLDEGCLSLILAHEIAHFYQPDFWLTLNTREAEADFFAVCNLVVMWDKDQYLRYIDTAIYQFEKYLKLRGKIPNISARIKVMRAAREFVCYSFLI